MIVSIHLILFNKSPKRVPFLPPSGTISIIVASPKHKPRKIKTKKEPTGIIAILTTSVRATYSNMLILKLGQ